MHKDITSCVADSKLRKAFGNNLLRFGPKQNQVE